MSDNIKINTFVDYVHDYYTDSEMSTYIPNLTREEVFKALAVRLVTGDTNEHGVPLNTIPFHGDSFDREYVHVIIKTIRGQ